MSKNTSTETICHYHHLIEDKIEDILKIDIAEFNNPIETIEKIHALADDIYGLVQKALMCGMSMEERLQKYRLAIEKLGFERIKHERK